MTQKSKVIYISQYKISGWLAILNGYGTCIFFGYPPLAQGRQKPVSASLRGISLYYQMYEFNESSANYLLNENARMTPPLTDIY